jgi:hypothetical protein
MRLIGHLESEASARTFADFLYVQGIQNQIEFSKGEGWALWINEEEKIEGATELFSRFRENPDDPKYRTEATRAGALRDEQSKSDEAWRKRLQNRRQLFRPLTGVWFRPVNICVDRDQCGCFFTLALWRQL